MSKLHITSVPIKRIQENTPLLDTVDLLVTEEPLEIQLIYKENENWVQKNLAVVMRTPMQDFELVLGFLYSEHIIQSFQDIAHIKYCENVRAEEKHNVIKVTLQPYKEVHFENLNRHFFTTSSCGVCGKSSIEALQIQCNISPKPNFKVPYSIFEHLIPALHKAQTVFQHTGGLHACALFDKEGNLLCVREDIGRHNALDKLIGKQLAEGVFPLTEHILLLSGRVSFEMIQKAIMAGLPIVVAVGAPSSLAVETAQRFGTTLVGFLRKGYGNVYAGNQRILL